MLNGGYVAAALLFIAALFGVLVIGLVVGWRAGRGSRPQLVLAWLLAVVLVPPWLLALTARYIGNLVENGEYPEDYDLLGEIVKNISYYNAVNYFGFDLK